jgi:drug/metabolite transporter (DMT)-like permease
MTLTPVEQQPIATVATLAPASAGRDVVIGYVFAILGAVSFSSKAIIIKLAYGEGVGVETLLALRMLFALPVYVAIGALSLRDRRRTGRGLPGTDLVVKAVLIGALGYWGASYLDFSSLDRLPAQFNVLILLTYPLFVVVFGALFFRLPVQSRAVAAFAISYMGIALIFFGKAGAMGGDIALGAGLALGAAILFALYMLFARSVIVSMGSRLFTCITMVAVSVMAIGQFLLVEPVSALAVTPAALGYVLLLAVVATLLPTFLLNAALQRVSAQANATIGTLSPVATILMAVVILGEALSPRDMIGAVLVIGGVGWFTIGGRR